MVLLPFLLSFLLPLVRAWLYSSGGEIRSDATHSPVRLRCINWYGAHMETFVAGGLDKRSCGGIADSILSIGANCVRIPLSVELVMQNPTPNASAIVGIDRSQCNVSTALDVLDCQVRELTRRGLMVILNNHVSFAGWVGGGERVPQGLWHTARFPTAVWIASLSALALRYRRNELVVGIDIRNEIHDQDGTVITWGQSNDTDSDWKAATLLADAAIRDVNPDVLVIVSGLSLAYDLRAMQDLRNYRSKYVFTTHVYTFSWWFTAVDWMLVLSLSLLFSAANLAVLLALRHKQHSLRQYMPVRNYRPTLSYVVAGAVLLPVYAVVVSLVWIQQAKQVGCTSIADDANAALYLGIVGLIAVVTAGCVLATHENVMCWSRLATFFCLWNTCLGLLQAALSVFYQTYWAVLWDLRRWHSTNIPVWVGEFGTVVGDTSLAWGWLMTYIRDMHYAYWTLNGCTQRFGTFFNETYGILDCDWTTIRNVHWTNAIFQDKSKSHMLDHR
jgi:Cellulase (glycosyl hydrolase family 5)